MFKKSKKTKAWDRENLIPEIHKSICTGEAVVGFKNIKTNEFVEEMLITNNDDLIKFKKLYDIDFDIKIVY